MARYLKSPIHRHTDTQTHTHTHTHTHTNTHTHTKRERERESSAIKQLLETLFLAIRMCTGFTTDGI